MGETVEKTGNSTTILRRDNGDYSVWETQGDNNKAVREIGVLKLYPEATALFRMNETIQKKSVFRKVVEMTTDFVLPGTTIYTLPTNGSEHLEPYITAEIEGTDGIEAYPLELRKGYASDEVVVLPCKTRCWIIKDCTPS